MPWTVRWSAGTPDDARTARIDERIERELRLSAVRAERAEIFRRARDNQTGSEVTRKLVRELDLLEARYGN